QHAATNRRHRRAVASIHGALDKTNCGVDNGRGSRNSPGMLCLDHWIAGTRDHGSSDRAGTVYNPATGDATAEVPFATAADVDRAVAAAREAFDGWSRTGLNKRATI